MLTVIFHQLKNSIEKGSHVIPTLISIGNVVQISKPHHESEDDNVPVPLSSLKAPKDDDE